VYSLELLLTITLVAAIIGLVVGYLLSQRTAPSQKNQRQLENHLHELQQQQQDYQQEVTEHFTQTAGLLNQLTSSYKDVHSHLAKGAQLLAGDQATGALQSLSDDRPTENSADIDPKSFTPPLDYAPKSTHEPGMLNEEFGIEKSNSEESEESTATPR
jgi:uncharacterized membrane-anchored protein YhcB (DUF1043 family)